MTQPSNLRITDVHGHIPSDGVGGFAGALLEALNRYGIQRIVVSGLGRGWPPKPTPADLRTGNEDVVALMRRLPGRVWGHIYVSLDEPGASVEMLNEFVGVEGMVSVKIWIARKCTDPKGEPVIQRAVELGLPMLIHTYFRSGGNLAGESSPADVAELARRFPAGRFVCAHLVTAAYEWNCKAIRDVPNVFGDIGGNPPEAGGVEFAVRELGEDRVVFGSDVPCRGFGNPLGKVLGADLPGHVKEKILVHNPLQALFGNRRRPCPGVSLVVPGQRGFNHGRHDHKENRYEDTGLHGPGRNQRHLQLRPDP